jgi:hypothetical protein
MCAKSGLSIMMNKIISFAFIFSLLNFQVANAVLVCGDFTKESNYVYAHTDKLYGIVGVAMADFDGGGDNEIITVAHGKSAGSSTYGERAAMSNNSGSLPHTLNSGNQDGIVDPFQVRSVDLDVDGNMDVIVAADVISYYAGDGTDVTKNDDSTEVTIATNDAGRSNKEVIFASINNGADTRIDVIIADSYFDNIVWYEPNVTYTSFTAHDVATSYNGAIGAAAIDLDSDGDIDIVASAQADTDISWFENDGSGNFTKNTIISSGYSPTYLRLADMDGDGDEDIVVISRNGDRVDWMERTGATSFSGSFTSIDGSIDAPLVLQVADIDEDGDIDVVVTADNDLDDTGFGADDSNDDLIVWYENDGTGSFTKTTLTSSCDPRGFVLYDYDGDSHLDIVVADYGDSAVYLWTNSCTTTSDGQLFFVP